MGNGMAIGLFGFYGCSFQLIHHIRAIAARSRGRRKYVRVGLTATIQAADTSFTRSNSPGA
jgi:hypothetical protein